MIGIAYIALKGTDGATYGHACVQNGFVELFLRRELSGEATVLTRAGFVTGGIRARIRASCAVRAVAVRQDGRLLCCGVAQGERLTIEDVARLMSVNEGGEPIPTGETAWHDRDAAVLQALKRLRAAERVKAPAQEDLPAQTAPQQEEPIRLSPAQAPAPQAQPYAEPAENTYAEAPASPSQAQPYAEPDENLHAEAPASFSQVQHTRETPAQAPAPQAQQQTHAVDAAHGALRSEPVAAAPAKQTPAPIAVGAAACHAQAEPADAQPDEASLAALFRRVQAMDARIRSITPPCVVRGTFEPPERGNHEMTACPLREHAPEPPRIPMDEPQAAPEPPRIPMDEPLVAPEPPRIRMDEPQAAPEPPRIHIDEPQASARSSEPTSASPWDEAREGERTPCEADRLAEALLAQAEAHESKTRRSEREGAANEPQREAQFHAFRETRGAPFGDESPRSRVDEPFAASEPKHAPRAVRTPILNPFPHIFPNARFYREVGAHTETLLGTWEKGGERSSITAVAGDYSPHPPAHLAGFTRYIRSRTGGYWVKVEALRQ